MAEIVCGGTCLRRKLFVAEMFVMESVCGGKCCGGRRCGGKCSIYAVLNGGGWSVEFHQSN